MKKTHHNNVLFTTLVVISFFTVVAFWLPQFKDTISGFSSSLNGASTALGGIPDQWSDAQKQMKTILPLDREKSAPPSQEQSDKQEVKQVLQSAVSDQLVASSSPPSVAQKSSLDERFRNHCTRRGGYHQDRMGPGELSYGVCVFANGSECEEEMFFRDRCDIGQYTVAEDGIPRKPDLVILDATVAPCVNRLQICFSSVTVTNRGPVRSPSSTLAGGENTYPIPALKSGETVTLDRTIPVTQDSSGRAQITIDQDNTIQEIHEDNNTYYTNANEE